MPHRLRVGGSRISLCGRVRPESPDDLGVYRVKLKEAEPNARDGQVVADLLEWQRLDLTETCRTTEPACDYIARLGLVADNVADDGDRSQRLTVGVGRWSSASR